MTTQHWFLEDLGEGGKRVVQIPLVHFPVEIGRAASCALALRSRRVSNRHAEIFEESGTLKIREFGSTNGTFVNGHRVSSAIELKDGDLIHIADQEFRLVQRARDVLLSSDPAAATHVDFSMGSIEKLGAIQEMLESRGLEEWLRVEFQPLIHLAEGSVYGHEALGRAHLFGSVIYPGELFTLAAKLSLEPKLSTALREASLREAEGLGRKLFVNTHPQEFDDERALLTSLEELRKRHESIQLVLEVHEKAVADLAVWRRLSEQIQSLGIELAFDDFGVGQNRLMELGQISVSYLKFDALWVRELHQSSKRHLEMVRSLVSMASSLGIKTIAEGVETADEAAACELAGFDIGQGYFFGYPAPAS